MDTGKARVLIVDDDEFIRDFIADNLGDDYEVLCAESAASGLAQAGTSRPALILADVQMPDMDGYQFCAALKEDFDLSDIPVLFLSALDGIEDRLRGFEVGGEDFVTKPVSPKVLQAKISRVLQLQDERNALRAQASYATSTAMVAMTSMSETGMLIEALKKFGHSADLLELGRAVLEALALFGLNGVTELIQQDGQSIALNGKGPASELEISVMHHMATMDRITQFRNRLAISYPQVRMVVLDMPLDDPDRCGRLRDHLAILVEAANERLHAIYNEQKLHQRGEVIDDTVRRLVAVLGNIDAAQRKTRADSITVLNSVIRRFEEALVGLQLTDRQEHALLHLVKDGMEDIYNVQLAQEHFQNQLTEVVSQLKNS